MYCQKCGKQLEDEAKVCSGCGKKIKSVKKKSGATFGMGLVSGILIMILVLAIAFIIFTLKYPNIIRFVSGAMKLSDLSSSVVVAEDKDKKSENDKSSKVENQSGTVGESLQTKVWKLSLTSVKQMNEIKGEFFTDTPDNGKVYLVCEFQADNISDKDDYLNMMYFTAYVNDEALDSVITMNKPDGLDTMTGDVAVGKKLKGCIIYEVPASWNKFEVTYRDGIASSSPKMTFEINPSQIAE